VESSRNSLIESEAPHSAIFLASSFSLPRSVAKQPGRKKKKKMAEKEEGTVVVERERSGCL
jgi:hypothetical protein